jgi:hypothetical protein
MAIIVEEEKKKSDFSSSTGWIVMLVLAGVTSYYVFFASPPPTVTTPPPGYEDIAPITQIGFDPTSVANSSAFQALRQYIPEPTSSGPVSVGKQNPFVQ